MKLESCLRSVLAVAIAVSFAAPGCDALGGKSDGSAEKESKSKQADDEGDDDSDDDKKKKKKSKKGDSAKADTAAKSPATTATAKQDTAPAVTGQSPTPPTVPVTNPSLQTYPDLANKISDSCATPWVIMAQAPSTAGIDYPWTWTRQAMLANQQFKVVAGEPAAPGEVAFQLHQASDKFQNAWVLVAKCQDGGTCNKLGAMYKAIVKGATAQPVCGALTMDLSPATFKKPVLRELGASQNTLPESSDVMGQCARLQACSVAMDPPAKAGKENIGFDCQKGPSKFKTACATRYPCAEVMKCLEGG